MINVTISVTTEKDREAAEIIANFLAIEIMDNCEMEVRGIQRPRFSDGDWMDLGHLRRYHIKDTDDETIVHKRILNIKVK